MANTNTGRIYQRGRTYWIDYGFRGERHRESSKSEKVSVARTLLRKRLEEMGRGKLVGPTEERVTFEDLAKMIESDYKVNGRKSGRRLGPSLHHLRAFFALSPALSITTDRIREYIVARQEAGVAAASIQKELAAVKRAFNLAVQAGRLTSKPHIPSIAVNNTREGFVEASELESVLAELPPDLRPVARFAYLTGWQKAEVMSLQWSQVDWTAGEVRLAPGSTKNNEGRSFPFRALPALEVLLEAQREHARTVGKKIGTVVPHIFHRNGKPILSIDRAWRTACKNAGLEGLLFHDLRRSAVRNMECAGVSRSVAMKLSGHKTAAVFARYAIADSAALSEGVEKLARLSTAEPRKVVPIHALSA